MADRNVILSATCVAIVGWIVYLFFQAHSIWGGDSGDLVTAAAIMGVPHPPGYPLFTFLGFLASRIPLFTASWRVALLSSLPHAMTLGGVFIATYVITGNSRASRKKPVRWTRIAAAMFAVVLLGGNYLFFLYSITPEVFALLDLFLITLLLLGIAWYGSQDRRVLFVGALVFGLSLTHHHTIVFLVPALLYLAHKKRATLRSDGVRLFPAAVFFLIGVLPYLYVPVAARTNAIINWDHAVDIPNLIKLASRADYGTFLSGGSYGGLLIQRLYQIRMYADLLILDVKIPGMILAGIGFVWLWWKKRDLALYLGLVLLFMGPVFFFYASFPLVNRFTLGTYERFLLPSYLVISILIGVGWYAILSSFPKLLQKRKKTVTGYLRIGVCLVLWLFPVVSGCITLWRFWGVPQDRTADRFGEDILSSVPEGAVLLLGRDTPLFITQYVRYARKYRSDVAVLHGTLLPHPASKDVLKKAYPELAIPSSSGDEFVSDFIRENRSDRPVFSNIRFPLDEGWYWISHGLVYRLVEEKDLPTPDVLLEENQRLWNMYANPLDGILSRYKHLMLADILDVYAGARVEFGKILLKAGKTNEAVSYFDSAIGYDGDAQLADAYLYKGLASLFRKDCRMALESFASSRDVSLSENVELLMYEAVTYRDCVGDTSQADVLWKLYQERKKAQETPLQQW